MKTNIIISPSQQTKNICLQGDSEADHCRLIAEKVVELLKKYECNVWLVPKVEGSESEVLTKVVNSSNYFVSTNPSDADFHLDIHTDAGYNKTGASGFFFSEGGKAFIQKVHKEIAEITPWSDGICSLRDLYVLRHTTAIAGLIEISFHDRENESSWIHENINKIADAIVRGIVKATEIVPKQLSPITNVDEAIKILFDAGIVSNIEYRKKVCDCVLWENEFVLNMANYINKCKV